TASREGQQREPGDREGASEYSVLSTQCPPGSGRRRIQWQGGRLAPEGEETTSPSWTTQGRPPHPMGGNMRSPVPFDWELPELLRGRLGGAAGRQRAMAADGHLLLILHQPPSAGVPERTARVFWRDPQGEWRANALGGGAQALRKHVAE